MDSSSISVFEFFKASKSANGIPSTQSSVMTLLPDVSQWMFGIHRSASPFVFAENSDAAEASSLKSNSPCTTESKCSMTSSGLKRRDLGDNSSIIFAAR